jgi:hypothetical protein
MRVLLVDVDSTIPNLALMRLSGYHKAQLDHVHITRLNISYYPHRRRKRTVDVGDYDRVYVSAIFKGTLPNVEFIGDSKPSKIQFGGTGVDVTTVLPSYVEATDLDYSIYPDNDTAYGFISRGCNRKCYFCVVPAKEGKVRQVETDLEKIIGGFKRVKFMDNNFLQMSNHVEILEWLVARKIPCQFNQGLDIRCITPQNAQLIGRLNYIGEYIFAFDDYKYRRMIERQLALLTWLRPWGAKFYCYVHPDMELYETVRRVQYLKERQLLPYVMRDIACWDAPNADFYVDIAAYVNQPNIFKKMDFYEYCQKRAISHERKAKSWRLWVQAESDAGSMAVAFDDALAEMEAFDMELATFIQQKRTVIQLAVL